LHIEISDAVVAALEILPSRKLGLKHVFVNKDGRPMNARKWSEDNWGGPLKKLEIRHRKFYAARPTFITLAIKSRENPRAVAQHCGTSLAMIQQDYCGRLELKIAQKWHSEQAEVAENKEKEWLRGRDLNPGPQGYEPCELPDCSTPRQTSEPY
jgi:integrase